MKDRRERTEQLDIFCRVTGFTSDFLSFIDVELIRFSHGALRIVLPPVFYYGDCSVITAVYSQVFVRLNFTRFVP